MGVPRHRLSGKRKHYSSSLKVLCVCDVADTTALPDGPIASKLPSQHCFAPRGAEGCLNRCRQPQKTSGTLILSLDGQQFETTRVRGTGRGAVTMPLVDSCHSNGRSAGDRGCLVHAKQFQANSSFAAAKPAERRLCGLLCMQRMPCRCCGDLPAHRDGPQFSPAERRDRNRGF